MYVLVCLTVCERESETHTCRDRDARDDCVTHSQLTLSLITNWARHVGGPSSHGPVYQAL